MRPVHEIVSLSMPREKSPLPLGEGVGVRADESERKILEIFSSFVRHPSRSRKGEWTHSNMR